MALGVLRARQRRRRLEHALASVSDKWLLARLAQGGGEQLARVCFPGRRLSIYAIINLVHVLVEDGGRARDLHHGLVLGHCNGLGRRASELSSRFG